MWSSYLNKSVLLWENIDMTLYSKVTGTLEVWETHYTDPALGIAYLRNALKDYRGSILALVK